MATASANRPHAAIALNVIECLTGDAVAAREARPDASTSVSQALATVRTPVGTEYQATQHLTLTEIRSLGPRRTASGAPKRSGKFGPKSKVFQAKCR
jgi:hypothetical protein